jgi:hypothetical protein
MRLFTVITISVISILTLTAYANQSYSSPSPRPTADLLRQVIVAHYQAIEENRLEEAMHFYHSKSPEIVQTRENIEFDLSQFLLKTTTMNFCYNGQQGEFAVATAKHRYLMIVGIKFIEHLVDVKYQLREEQGSWKIWTQSKISNVSSNC